MGLLDWNDEPDELFPDFAAGLQTPKPTDSTSSNGTTQDNTTATGRDRTSSEGSHASSTSSSSRRNTNVSLLRPKLHRRSPSFDLFGDDEELQDAEPRINFCQICLKHCVLH